MTPVEFVLWMQGVIDTVDGQSPNEKQWNMIKSKMEEAIVSAAKKRMMNDEAEREDLVDKMQDIRPLPSCTPYTISNFPSSISTSSVDEVKAMAGNMMEQAIGRE